MPTISPVSLQIAVGVPDPASAQVTVFYSIAIDRRWEKVGTLYVETAHLWRRIQGRADQEVLNGSMEIARGSLTIQSLQRSHQKVIPLKNLLDPALYQGAGAPVGSAPRKVMSGPSSPSLPIGPVHVWAVVRWMPDVPTATIATSNAVELAAARPKLTL